jgi:hypothetical protein
MLPMFTGLIREIASVVSFANSISTWHRNFGYIVKMHAIIFSEFYGRNCERYEEFSIY